MSNRFCRMKFALVILITLISFDSISQIDSSEEKKYEILVLGVAQDAGIPQAACNKKCCIDRFANSEMTENVTSLAILDVDKKKYWLIEASPDIKYQINDVNKYLQTGAQVLPEAIFISHAHIGHYTGLMHFGRESIGSSKIPVYAMPRLRTFLEQNGPWSQLVTLQNIELHTLSVNTPITLSEGLEISCFEVPHRDEYSETAGFIIKGENRSAVFIPDIDKWKRWNTDVLDLIKNNAVAYLDGTFYDANELPGRDMSEIPHPFITESMELMSPLSASDRQKVRFIHLNHTNPAYDKESNAANEIKIKGFKIAVKGEIETL